MSDPLQNTRTTIDKLSLSQHAFMPLSEAEVRKLVPVADKLSDREKAARLIETKRLDVLMQYARRVPKLWCADPEIVKQLQGKNGDNVFLASSTAGVDVRMPVPRLLKTAQEFVDALPGTSVMPATRSAVLKVVRTKAFVGGGAHWALKRILEHGPKKGATVPVPPTKEEVVEAMASCGRVSSGAGKVWEEVRELQWEGQEVVQFTAESDNGFPVGLNMLDPYARKKLLGDPDERDPVTGRLVPGLAPGFRELLEASGDPESAFRTLQDEQPEFTLCKGKAKLDVYGIAKVSGGLLRFYNAVPRQWVLIIQQASQPLSDMWKDGNEGNYRSFIGKGMARGGAAALCAWLDGELSRKGGVGLAWSHAGDDTLLIRGTAREEGGYEYEIFSLDCTAFDLTQHKDATAEVHSQIAKQMRGVDRVSGAVWHGFMRRRDVTVSGSLVVRTEHWGPSGMPLQSEVNDTLMDVLCMRLSRKDWSTKQMLDELVQEEGRKLGFKVRLEDHFAIASRTVQESPTKWLLARRPFLFVGYHLYCEDGAIWPQLDVQRFASGMSFLNGQFEKDASAVGVKVALALAGYALSFGRPHPEIRPAWEVLRTTAIEAVSEKALQLSPEGMTRELSKYVYAGLSLSLEDVAGLVSALRREPESIWGGYVAPSDVTFAQPVAVWADEPEEPEWKRAAKAFLGQGHLRFGPQLNQAQAVSASRAGLAPPVPVSVRKEQEKKARERAERVAHYETRDKAMGSYQGARKKIAQQDKRSGVLVGDEDDFEPGGSSR